MTKYFINITTPLNTNFKSLFVFHFKQTLRVSGVEATKRLMRLDPNYLPPSVNRLIAVVRKTVNLFNDIRTDVMEFYQV